MNELVLIQDKASYLCQRLSQVETLLCALAETDSRPDAIHGLRELVSAASHDAGSVYKLVDRLSNHDKPQVRDTSEEINSCALALNEARDMIRSANLLLNESASELAVLTA